MDPMLRPRTTGNMGKVDSYLQNFTDRAAQSRIRNFPALERATLSSVQFTK